jgi:hypothetical protein
MALKQVCLPEGGHERKKLAESFGPNARLARHAEVSAAKRRNRQEQLPLRSGRR